MARAIPGRCSQCDMFCTITERPRVNHAMHPRDSVCYGCRWQNRRNRLDKLGEVKPDFATFTAEYVTRLSRFQTP